MKAQFQCLLAFCQGWSSEGDLLVVETSMKSVTVEVVLENAPWSEYRSACFLPTCPDLFISLDRYNTLQSRDINTKVIFDV
jgi:hypothetical protein